MNLSHSGAADQPRIVAAPDGRLQVFWWDRFDGLMTAYFDNSWSDPTPAPILAGDESGSSAVGAMPYIMADALGRAHAFWLGEVDRETGARPLMHSQMTIGGTSWSSPGPVAESAVSFDMAADASGALHLAYVRTLHTSDLPAGIYYRRSDDGGATWSTPVALDTSHYFRLLSSGEAHVRLAADGAGGVTITWDDPRLERALFAHSADGGATWQGPQGVGEPEGQPLRGRMVVVPGGQTLMLWEDARVEGMCGLYQASVSDLLAGAEGTARRVLAGLNACPQDERFLPVGEGQVLMVAGNGSDVLTLALWDGSTGPVLSETEGLTTGGSQWSEPRQFSFGFMDTELGKQVHLKGLQAALVALSPNAGQGLEGKALIAVGVDQGDVWVTSSQMDTLELFSALSLPPALLEDKAEAEPSAPVNLSHSGTTCCPAIVAGPDGTLRVFWWDYLDGLTVADGAILASSAPSGTEELVTSEEIWSGPRSGLAPSVPMPRFVVDVAGRAHLFWLVGAGELMHSRLAAGGVPCSSPAMVAESAVRLDVVADASGALHLAYVRTLHTSEFPAGIYYRRSDDGGAIWSAPVALDASRYFRLLSSEDAHVRLAADGVGGVYVTWDDPRLERALFAYSADGGATWQGPQGVGDPEGLPRRARVVVVPGGQTLLLWEDARVEGTCGLYQTSVSELLAGAGGVGQRVLEGLIACPQDERFLPVGEGQVLMVAGSGSDVLTLALWDGSTGPVLSETEGLTTGGNQWSEPRQLSFSFMDTELGKQVNLSDLQAALVALSPNAGQGLEGKALIAVGVDQEGDVWVTSSQMGALKLVFAPPSPWSEPVRLSQEGEETGWPTVALDMEGGVHMAWSQGAGGGGPGTALLYTRWDGTRWSWDAEVVSGASGEEMARQPALIADGRGLLHLVWSGGQQGQIVYSRAVAREATWAGGWSPVQSLSPPATAGSWPQIGVDAAGRLYVVYAVPLNEGRGIYLTQSDDGGETWSEPKVVFDAAAAGWAMVDHPTLAVAPDGTLHVVWVWGALPGTWPPLGMYYARSDDGGDSWTEPLKVAGPGYDWPRLALGPQAQGLRALAGGQVHLLYAEAGGGVWHRWFGAEEQAESGNGWSTARQVRGWEGAAGPFGLATDGRGTLHLVGVDADGEALLYSAWDGSRWSPAEAFSPGSEVGKGLGVAAASLPQGGRLAVALRAPATGEGEKAVPVVLYTERTIPPVDVLPPPTPAAPPTPVMTASPTPQPTAVPSPTPDLTSGPPPSGSSMDPLLLGGGLAALIVVGVLATWGVRRGRE